MDQHRERILLITQDFPPIHGGIQTYCYQLALSLHQIGYDIEVLCPGKACEFDQKSPFKIHRWNLPTSFLFIGLWALPLWIKSRSFDRILYGQWQSAIWLNLPFFKSKKLKYNSMVHGRELLTSVFNPFTSYLARKTLNQMDVCFPNSNAVQDLLTQTVGVKSTVKVNFPGVNPDAFYPLDALEEKKKRGWENSKVLLTVTRMVARKNIISVIQAMPLIVAEIPNALYVIGGRGPESEALQKAVAESPVSQNILFLGTLENHEILPIYNAADVSILVSEQNESDIEGFGIVYLEAGACEKPVVAANTGGVSDAVLHEKTGLLIQNPLDLNQIAQAVIRLFKNTDEAQTMGHASRARILNELTWEKVAQNYFNS